MTMFGQCCFGFPTVYRSTELGNTECVVLACVTSYTCGASLVNIEHILRLPTFNFDSCCCKLKTKCATALDVHLMSMYVIAHVFSEISAASSQLQG